MIYEVSGDILLTKAKAIAHGVAPNDHMDTGLAFSLRERWPAMAKDFRHYCRQRHPKAGELWSWPNAEGQLFVNLLTQEPAPDEHARAGRAKIEHVNHALRGLRKLVEEEQLSSLALTKLATGAGGLEWASVRPLVQQHLGDLPIPIYLYTTYHAGQPANEPTSNGR